MENFCAKTHNKVKFAQGLIFFSGKSAVNIDEAHNMSNNQY
ncbi:uncharacterized protein METZ01_LOCUS300275 [marine metagenome]|uniref:Uncharacterized protein n=1 Tax=marine metagenome TaxID=408172 RepID=A0A382MJH8_9ZZZZ